jgi:hypothetical protein
MLPPKHSTIATLEFLAGRGAMIRGDATKARALLLTSVGLYEAAPDKNLGIVRALSALAIVQQQLGDAEGARASAARGVEIARKAATGFEHTEWLGSALVAQGTVLAAQGDEKAAEAALEEGRAQLLGSVGPLGPALHAIPRSSKA